MTGNPALRQALAYARRGWPVFPCQPGQKIPATRHGYALAHAFIAEAFAGKRHGCPVPAPA